MSDYEALRAAAEAATPGPWTAYLDHWSIEVQCAERTPVVAWLGFDDSDRPRRQHKANAAYIAAMSPDVALDLLAQLAEQREREAAKDAEIARLRGVMVYLCQEGCTHDGDCATEYGDDTDSWCEVCVMRAALKPKEPEA